MPSLFDFAAPGRRQKARLQGLFSPPEVPPPVVENPAQSLFSGGGTDVENQSRGGKAFSEMTNQELRDYSDRRNNGNFMERNLGKTSPLSALNPMSLISSLVMNGLEKSQLPAEFANRGLSNPGDFVGGQIAGAANTGMNVAGGAANPELAGRNDLSQMSLEAQIAAAEAAGQMGDPTMGGGVGVNAADLGAEPNAPGMYAKGGKVTGSLFEGVDPPGPDNVIIAAKTGERVLNEEQYASLSNEAKAEVDRALKKTEAGKKKR